jgi:uroporphyrinogen-III decarboxylase
MAPDARSGFRNKAKMARKMMTSRERMLTALERGIPDRVPVTIHQWQPYHLHTYMGGMSDLDAFRATGLDAAVTIWDANDGKRSAGWQIDSRSRRGEDGGWIIDTTITTPEGVLSQRDESNDKTTWTVETLIKRPEDMRLVQKYLPVPKLNKEFVRSRKRELGEAGILRGLVFGEQAGPWQHAGCLVGIERLIMATFDDPGWVHELLRSLTEKKLQFIEESLAGADFDLIEMGGGAASSTVISPKIFKNFCLPYDRVLHDALHAVGHKVAYHTCGGMMPILELIVENGCDAAETLSPAGVGGDAIPAEIKRRIGGQVCLIGGMDQVNILSMGAPEEIRLETRRLFEALGPGGGYILSACDHFFDAPVENLRAFAEAGEMCVYD